MGLDRLRRRVALFWRAQGPRRAMAALVLKWLAVGYVVAITALLLLRPC